MSLFDMVFGCRHKRCSFPITIRGKLRRTTAAASVTGTYVVCLDYGREFPYDWSQMKMLASTPPTGWAPERATIIPSLKVAGDRCRALRGASTSASGPSNGLVVSWAGNGSPRSLN